VLDRIEMHVVDVPLEISLVSNRVLPEAPLPEHVFAIAMTRHRHAVGHQPMREVRFDALPAAGEVGIACRQRPDGMQVIRQDHDGLDREWTLVPRKTESHPQSAHVMHEREGCPVSERDREKIGASWNEFAPVSDHLRMLPRIALRSIRATN
jgi:hypothetical protein